MYICMFNQLQCGKNNSRSVMVVILKRNFYYAVSKICWRVYKMKPVIQEFKDDTELMNVVKSLSEKGVSKDNLYVMSHDDDRTNRVADSVDANKVGMSEVGFDTYVSNIFSKKGDQLRSQLEELGFTELEANNYEEKLDQGTILLVNTNPDI